LGLGAEANSIQQAATTAISPAAMMTRRHIGWS
jgi:hypothetical protein